MIRTKTCMTCRYGDWNAPAINCNMCRGFNQWVSKDVKDDVDLSAWQKEIDKYNDRQNYN